MNESSDHRLHSGPILLFDGVCNLCKSSVQFVIKRDPNARFRFASLQSKTGRELAAKHGLKAAELDSVILIDKDEAYRKSSAALRTAAQLRAPWPMLAAFLIVPPAIRHWVYDYIGHRRYRWFGKMETCWAPDAALAERFLD